MLRKKTLEALTQKKKKKKGREGIERDRRGRQIFLKNSVMIPFYFWIKMIFNRLEGIKPGIKKALKTGSTNREELKKESN